MIYSCAPLANTILFNRCARCKTINLFMPQRIHPVSKTIRLPLCVRRLLKGHGLSDSATLIILQFWRTLLKTVQVIPSSMDYPVSATVTHGINFTSELYDNKNLSCSSMNIARSASSPVIFPSGGCTFGNHPLLGRLLKGTFSTRPSLTRYHCVECSDRAKYPKTLYIHLKTSTFGILR